MATLPEGTADAFNQWMQDYINNPEKFMRDWQTITEFRDTDDGAEPNYGKQCVALLERYIGISETSRDPAPTTPPPA